MNEDMIGYGKGLQKELNELANECPKYEKIGA